ncbi:MAG: YicC/YloC family endoribonuclease [Candidatus Kapaibacterium sp.]
MISSMTAFSKNESNEAGITVTIEIKSLNGRFLDINCKMPRTLAHKELEVRDIVKTTLNRGTININMYIEFTDPTKEYSMDRQLAANIFSDLSELKKELKLRENVKIEHLLNFSNHFYQKETDDNEALQWKLLKRALRAGLKSIKKMRDKEGGQIARDIRNRMNSIKNTVEKIETLGLDRIPEERERLRQKIAQLFEMDEIDESRLRMEMVLQADKLDISEECVRLQSHFKFFFEAFNSKEPVGRRMNFLLQEMHREVNTIGSKASDAEISQLVVSIKEELERIREQVQNIE